MPRGGARPGAGRPKGSRTETGRKLKAAEARMAKDAPTTARFKDAAEFCMSVINDATQTLADQLKAAMIVIPYQMAKPGELPKGKKEDQADKARQAASGKFAAPAPPKLAVDNTKA